MVHNHGSWELASLGKGATVRRGAGAVRTLEYGVSTLGDGGNAIGAGNGTFGSVGSTLGSIVVTLGAGGGTVGSMCGVDSLGCAMASSLPKRSLMLYISLTWSLQMDGRRLLEGSCEDVSSMFDAILGH